MTDRAQMYHHIHLHRFFDIVCLIVEERLDQSKKRYKAAL